MQAVKRMIPLYLFSLSVVLACAVLTSRAVGLLARTASAELPALLPTVVVDPGHGGEDGGAVSPGGVKESDLNLETSLRLRDLLDFVGIPTVMTRRTDLSIFSPEARTVSEKKISDLKNRVRLVEQTPNALLISIHQNMFSQSKYRGAQVFYRDSSGSRTLAETIQELLRRSLDPGNHRKAKENQTAYLLTHIHCTAVLVECGFLSNPEEEALLQTAAYQKKLAAVVCAGLWTHLQEQKET